jgi:hypothetical protein
LVFDLAYEELATIDFRPLKIDLGSIGRRRDWLAADLRALATALPAPQSLGFELPTSGHGFGCLYVLEGSALGGQVVSKRVKEALGLGPATGGAYFHGLGRQTASHWSDFLTTLNTIPANSAMVLMLKPEPQRHSAPFDRQSGYLVTAKLRRQQPSTAA